jgi:hypothetical protein
MNVLVLHGSPRRGGNSELFASMVAVAAALCAVPTFADTVRLPGGAAVEAPRLAEPLAIVCALGTLRGDSFEWRGDSSLATAPEAGTHPGDA